METILRRKLMVRKCLIMVMIVGVVSSIVLDGTEGSDKPKNTLSGSDKIATVSYELSQDMLVLDDKGEDYVLFCKRRFAVTSTTSIMNEFGSIITLEELMIPCKAMVSYYKKPGERNEYIAVSIEVKGEPEPLPE
jgi:hypothetical protein